MHTNMDAIGMNGHVNMRQKMINGIVLLVETTALQLDIWLSSWFTSWFNHQPGINQKMIESTGVLTGGW